MSIDSTTAKAGGGDAAKDPAARRVILVTGMSGAGRTAALKSLEDIGYQAVDNLPLSLLAGFARPAQGDLTPAGRSVRSGPHGGSLFSHQGRSLRALDQHRRRGLREPPRCREDRWSAA